MKANGHLSVSERQIQSLQEQNAALKEAFVTLKESFAALEEQLKFERRILGASVEAAGGDYCFSAEMILKARRLEFKHNEEADTLTVIVTDVPEPTPVV